MVQYLLHKEKLNKRISFVFQARLITGNTEQRTNNASTSIVIVLTPTSLYTLNQVGTVTDVYPLNSTSIYHRSKQNSGQRDREQIIVCTTDKGKEVLVLDVLIEDRKVLPEHLKFISELF